jgi:hypothetical protein
MALRLSWFVYADPCTVYWFPSESEPSNYSFDGYVAKTLGRRPDSAHVRLPGTPAEVSSWAAAAKVYVDEVAASERELQASEDRARQLRGTWRRSAKRMRAEAEAEAEAAHRERVGAARARYQPVLEVIERRLAEHERAERAAAAKEAEARKRQLEAARARFEAWEQQWALAGDPLFDGRSARELAAGGANAVGVAPGDRRPGVVVGRGPGGGAQRRGARGGRAVDQRRDHHGRGRVGRGRSARHGPDQ